MDALVDSREAVRALAAALGNVDGTSSGTTLFVVLGTQQAFPKETTYGGTSANINTYSTFAYSSARLRRTETQREKEKGPDYTYIYIYMYLYMYLHI